MEQESQEQEPSDVSLSIRQPDGDKNFMIGFEAETELACRAYNYVIKKVLQEQNWQPFHQVGLENQPGYHAWEIWKRVDQEAIEKLLPSIEEQAKDYIKRWEE